MNATPETAAKAEPKAERTAPPAPQANLDVRHPGIGDADELAWEADSRYIDDSPSTLLRRLRDEGPREQIPAMFEQHYIEVWFTLPPDELRDVLLAATDEQPQRHPVFAYIRAMLNGESVPLLGDARAAGLKAPNAAVHTTMLSMAILEARLQGELRTALALSDRIAQDAPPANALVDPSRGNAAFMFVQAGITRLLGGDFAGAAGLFERAKWTSPPPGLAFLMRDAHAKAALVSALVGDPAAARRELGAAETVERTASWAEPMVDATARMAEVLLDAASGSDAVAQLAAMPRTIIGELWPVYVLALAPAVLARDYEAERIVDALEAAGLPGAEKGEGLTGSAFALVRAAKAQRDGNLLAARAALAAADEQTVLVALADAGLALESGSAVKARSTALRVAEQTVCSRQLELWRVTVLLLAHRALGESAAADAVQQQALRLADGLQSFPLPAAGVVRGQLDALLRGETASDSQIPAVTLTAREQDVLHLLAEGASRKDMAARLFVSVNTIKTQVSSIYRKFGVTDRSELIARAHSHGII